eukprot:TRINITY_DN615_c1_g2_i2.p1 TRINITY_DN615_c1_g2~~TRINITY_DN615_c1_g2_i2.p1  ORF type:complete len:219 (+),score=87.40 TRINITY_DN615_c1_g2_i2:71-727(+)
MQSSSSVSTTPMSSSSSSSSLASFSSSSVSVSVSAAQTNTLSPADKIAELEAEAADLEKKWLSKTDPQEKTVAFNKLEIAQLKLKALLSQQATVPARSSDPVDSSTGQSATCSSSSSLEIENLRYSMARMQLEVQTLQTTVTSTTEVGQFILAEAKIVTFSFPLVDVKKLMSSFKAEEEKEKEKEKETRKNKTKNKKGEIDECRGRKRKRKRKRNPKE